MEVALTLAIVAIAALGVVVAVLWQELAAEKERVNAELRTASDHLGSLYAMMVVASRQIKEHGELMLQQTEVTKAIAERAVMKNELQ